MQEYSFTSKEYNKVLTRCKFDPRESRVKPMPLPENVKHFFGKALSITTLLK